MADLDSIYNKLKQIQDELANAFASMKLSPKQISIINGLSDINNSLGSVKAGEFLAMSSGEDPQDSNGTGTFMSAFGRLFGEKHYHIGGVYNGDLKWGANSVTGELEAGDGAVTLTEDGISIYNDTVEIGRIGNLNGFLTYAADVYGFAFGDDDAHITWDPLQGLRVINASTAEGDGWAAADVTWDMQGSDLLLTPSTVSYSDNTKIKYTQDASTKYATIAFLYSVPAGKYYTVTMHSGSFTANAVTDPYYSVESAPDGW